MTVCSLMAYDPGNLRDLATCGGFSRCLGAWLPGCLANRATRDSSKKLLLCKIANIQAYFNQPYEQSTALPSYSGKQEANDDSPMEYTRRFSLARWNAEDRPLRPPPMTAMCVGGMRGCLEHRIRPACSSSGARSDALVGASIGSSRLRHKVCSLKGTAPRIPRGMAPTGTRLLPA